MPKDLITVEDALKKMARFCAYRDRSELEARMKLRELGVPREKREEIIEVLFEENFLNEERYARSYVRGKFRFNKWGRNKIILNLRKMEIPHSLILRAFSEIEDEEYQQTLRALILRKDADLKEPNPFKRRNKIVNFVQEKGYEPPLVWDLVTRMEKEGSLKKEES